MTSAAQTKGTWFHRLAIRFFTVVFGVLVFWLLDFIVGDIRSLEGPDLELVASKYVDPQLVKQRSDLSKQLTDLTEQVAYQSDKQRVIGDTSRNLQQTVSQLVELQRLGLQKNAALSETEQANFNKSLNSFLDIQKKYQELGQTSADLLDQKRRLAAELEVVDDKLEQQRRPARDEYERLLAKHRLHTAGYQLMLFVPLLVVAAWLLVTKRAGLYYPLVLAFGVAVLVQVGLVVHEYFPSRYFKYILIGGLLVVVGFLLVHFIRTIAFPKMQWLFKQYREAYERFLCPVCEYPIRTGPRRFLYWTRRTVNKTVVPGESSEQQEEPYTCPSCGSRLFEKCPTCDQVRHAMLPHCAHCGAEKSFQQA